MNYKGYAGKIVDYDEETGLLHGRVLGIRDVVTFEAKTIEEAIGEFKKSLDVYLAFCAELGQEPAKPYSGEFRIRLTPDVHRKVALAAECDGQSMNEWVAGALASAAEERLSA